MSLSIKNIIKSTILIIISLFISSIILGLLYYFDLISNNAIKYIKMFLSIMIFFINGVYIGRKTNTKGYLSGLKLSLVIIILFIILGIIFNNINLSKIIYYIITTTCITFGSMIGINKNNSK